MLSIPEYQAKKVIPMLFEIISNSILRITVANANYLLNKSFSIRSGALGLFILRAKKRGCPFGTASFKKSDKIILQLQIW